MKQVTRNRSGFTLVELLVVIAIIGVLVALLLPAVQAAREAARRSQCLNNIRQIGLAVMNYESTQGTLPKGSTRFEGYTRNSWVTLVLPYIEEMSLYSQIDLSVSLDDVNNDPDIFDYHHIPFATFQCPSDERVDLVNDWYGARGNYAANVGIGFIWMDDESPEQDQGGNPYPLALAEDPNHKSSLWFPGTFQVNRGRNLREIEDGTSNTVAVCEIRTIEGRDTRGALHYGAAVMYMHDFTPNFTGGFDRTRWCLTTDFAPCFATQQTWRGGWTHTARSAHPGGVNAMLLDASVRFVSDDVEELLWRQVSTPAGQEVLTGEL